MAASQGVFRNSKASAYCTGERLAKSAQALCPLSLDA